MILVQMVKSYKPTQHAALKMNDGSEFDHVEKWNKWQPYLRWTPIFWKFDETYPNSKYASFPISH